MLFGGDRVGLGSGVCRFGLQEARRVLLGLFDRRCAISDQRLVALVLLLREGERGLGLRGLLVGFFDARLLRGDLGVDVGDTGGRLIDLRMSLVELSLVIAVIEANQHRARIDQLIVGHRHVDYGGIDLRTD